MVDIILINSFLKDLSNHSGILMVDDIDQLLSIGPCKVLANIITSNIVLTTKKFLDKPLLLYYQCTPY